MLVAHLAGGEGQVGQLQQQEPGQEVLAEPIVANDPRPQRRHRRGQQGHRRTAPVQGIINQRNIERCKDGEQQHFGHRKVAERPVQAKVGHHELQGAGDQDAKPQLTGHTAPAGHRQEQQRSQQHPAQHRKVAVHMACEKLADQTE